MEDPKAPHALNKNKIILFCIVCINNTISKTQMQGEIRNSIDFQ